MKKNNLTAVEKLKNLDDALFPNKPKLVPLVKELSEKRQMKADINQYFNLIKKIETEINLLEDIIMKKKHRATMYRVKIDALYLKQKEFNFKNKKK